MVSQYQHKLFLWIEGYFPKRIVYYLLAKGLCSSVDQLYEGNTNEPNLNVVRIVFNGQDFVSEDPDNPFPTETTVPALRLDDTSSGKSIWIRETWSIINYLEEVFPGTTANNYREMWANDPVERAITQDVLGHLLSASEQGGIWLDNNAPFLTAFRQISDEEHSIGVGRRARRAFEEHFKAAQEIAADNLERTGWLTPAADGGPGMADVNLAAMVRHTEDAWSEFVIENDVLEPLRQWYKKYQTVWFWHELEETGRFPDMLRRGEGSVQK
ncbi:hypothetical protein NW762_006478 [Fusarium torreyae]|uniref:GST N-terminal domain-containing protein n=1 Tax=Fusarium torreyae TaxID=1237075 RepID=A0A9W8VGV2_9HYPO|nr:hypothetical protein NW762_006478 [Fusarium torreyae]